MKIRFWTRNCQIFKRRNVEMKELPDRSKDRFNPGESRCPTTKASATLEMRGLTTLANLKQERRQGTFLKMSRSG
jgi:hypothetical protein